MNNLFSLSEKTGSAIFRTFDPENFPSWSTQEFTDLMGKVNLFYARKYRKFNDEASSRP